MLTGPKVTAHRQLRAWLTADFARNPYFFDRMTLVVWRFGQVFHARPGRVAGLARRLHTAADMVWMGAVIGAELPRAAQVGPGVRLPHAGRGVVIHPSTRIGSGATIYHRVTIGVRSGNLAPTLGDDVYVGTGAAVLGQVVVGDRARIGANAVVLRHVAAGETAVGVPARSYRTGHPHPVGQESPGDEGGRVGPPSSSSPGSGH